MKVRRITSARTGDAFGKHSENLVEVRARKITIRIGTAYSLEQFRFIPIFRSTHGYDMLRQNVQGSFGDGDAVEIALADRSHQCGTFEQLIPCGCEETTFGYCSAPVTRAPDALQSRRNGTRRANQANQIDGADIDSQFERSRRYQRPELSRFQFLLGHKPKLARQTAVVRGHGFLSQTLGKMMRHTLGETSCIDKYES